MTDPIILIEDGPDRKRMRVELTHYQNTPLLNVREWYKDKSSGELKPSRKGIALTRNNYLAVKSVIHMHHDKIMDHLRISANGDLSTADTSEIKATHGRRLQPISKIVWSISSFRPISSIYQIEFRGPVAEVIFNNAHPYISRVEKQANSNSKIDSIAEFIVGLELAKNQTLDEGLMEPSTLFELISDRTQRILTHLAGNLE